MLPPLTSAIAGPVYTGQVHVAEGKLTRPSAELTSIVLSVGVQIAAAHSAYSPWQILYP
jgi:hypothetical protein